MAEGMGAPAVMDLLDTKENNQHLSHHPPSRTRRQNIRARATMSTSNSNVHVRNPHIKLLLCVPALQKTITSFHSRASSTLLSEKTFNSVVFGIFYLGSWMHIFPVHPPQLVDTGKFGQIVTLKGRFSKLDTVVQAVSCGGLFTYFCFEVLQMIRLLPKYGFTFKTIFVIFYFVMTLLEFMITYTVLKHQRIVVAAWNNIERVAKIHQSHGAQGACHWKRSFVTISMILGAIAIAFFAYPVVMVVFIYRPNYPFHIFYLLPEAWKPFTTVYLIMVVWQAFILANACVSIVCMLTIAVCFIFCIEDMMKSVIQIDIRDKNSMTPVTRVKLYRMAQLLNQMANEAGSNFFLPVLVFFTIVGGVLFTYICLTKFGTLEVELYVMIAGIDVACLSIVTTVLLRCGQYRDAAEESIKKMKMCMKEPHFLANTNVQVQKRKVASLGIFGLRCGSFATINLGTVQQIHSTIIDNLLLLLSY